MSGSGNESTSSAKESAIAKLKMLARVAEVAGFAAYDAVRPQQTTDPEQVPASPEALTPEWLTAVLGQANPGVRVLTVKPGTRDNGSTSRQQISLTYNDAGEAAGLPTSMYTKSAPGFKTRLNTGPSHVAAMECHFYNDVRPGLAIEAPRSFYAGYDKRSSRTLILLEDLTTQNVTFTDPVKTTMTRPMAESQVRQMAAWHASLWGSARLQTGGDLADLSLFYDWQVNLNQVVAWEKNSLRGLDKARDICPPDVYERRAELWPAHMRSLELSRRAPITLIHGDTHLGNWYITSEGELGISDWHVMSKGCWALDFSYALTSALAIEDRRAWDRDLVQLYLECLRDRGVEPPSFDEAWLAYRQQTFHGLFFWLGTINTSRLLPKAQTVEVSRANLERMLQAVQDLGSFDALDQQAASSTPSAAR